MIRGCGTRKRGGIYAETMMGEDGLPLECFLYDPPKPIMIDHSLGVELIENDGVFHILDAVGREHYPYPSDFIEEVRNKGASRRIPRTVQFEKLSRESKMLLAHPFTLIDYEGEAGSRNLALCGGHARAGRDEHSDRSKRCSCDCWLAPPDLDRPDMRNFTDFTCAMFSEGDGIGETTRGMALIAALPIHRIVGIASDDPEDQAVLDEVRTRVLTTDLSFEILRE
jgi:hypothetical protein